MNVFEKSVRIFSDFVLGIIGQTNTDYTNGKAPLWSVIGVAILGILSISLIIIGTVFYFIK